MRWLPQHTLLFQEMPGTYITTEIKANSLTMYRKRIGGTTNRYARNSLHLRRPGPPRTPDVLFSSRLSTQTLASAGFSSITMAGPTYRAAFPAHRQETSRPLVSTTDTCHTGSKSPTTATPNNGEIWDLTHSLSMQLMGMQLSWLTMLLKV